MIYLLMSSHIKKQLSSIIEKLIANKIKKRMINQYNKNSSIRGSSWCINDQFSPFSFTTIYSIAKIISNILTEVFK